MKSQEQARQSLAAQQPEEDKDFEKLGVTSRGYIVKLCKLIRDARIASNETTSASSSGTTAESVSATSTPAIPAPHDGERPMWIYVDNSNIWINVKQLTARRKMKIIIFALTSGN